jgi:hypothetical protein
MGRLGCLTRGGRLVLALAVGGAVFGIASVVQAGITDSQDQIHGCYSANGSKQTNGTPLNVVDTAYSCSKGQASILWNQKGITGPTGARGPAGTNGQDGAPGVAGPPGPTGQDGSNGVTGPSGLRGPSGATGSPGATGPIGPTGPRGSGTASFVTTVSDAAPTVLATLPNGLAVSGSCGDITVAGKTVGPVADLTVATLDDITVVDHTVAAPLQMSGTGNSDFGGGPPIFPIDQNGSAPTADFKGLGYVDVDVIAREETDSGQFARIDAHGEVAASHDSCLFWGMTIPN